MPLFNERVQTLVFKISELQNQLSSKQTDYNDLQLKCARLDIKCEDLQNSLDSLDGNVDVEELNEAIDEANRAIEELESNLEAYERVLGGVSADKLNQTHLKDLGECLEIIIHYMDVIEPRDLQNHLEALRKAKINKIHKDYMHTKRLRLNEKKSKSNK